MLPLLHWRIKSCTSRILQTCILRRRIVCDLFSLPILAPLHPRQNSLTTRFILFSPPLPPPYSSPAPFFIFYFLFFFFIIGFFFFFFLFFFFFFFWETERERERGHKNRKTDISTEYSNINCTGTTFPPGGVPVPLPPGSTLVNPFEFVRLTGEAALCGKLGNENTVVPPWKRKNRSLKR